MNLFQIIIDILLVIISLYIAFFKSYFTEKWKNIATKEDIGYITKEIETVKNEVQYSNQIKIEINKEKKDIAITFYDQVSFFIDYSTKIIEVLANNQTNLELITKQTEDIRFQMSKLFGSFYKLMIYYEIESSFVKAANNYYNSGNKIHQLSISYLYELERYAQENSLLLKSFIDGDFSKKEDLLQNGNNSKKVTLNFISQRKELLDNEVYINRSAFILELSKLIHNTERF
jgi:hypothetical protein